MAASGRRSRRVQRQEAQGLQQVHQLHEMVHILGEAIQDHDYARWQKTALELVLLAGSVLMLTQEVAALVNLTIAS